MGLRAVMLVPPIGATGPGDIPAAYEAPAMCTRTELHDLLSSVGPVRGNGLNHTWVTEGDGFSLTLVTPDADVYERVTFEVDGDRAAATEQLVTIALWLGAVSYFEGNDTFLAGEDTTRDAHFRRHIDFGLPFIRVMENEALRVMMAPMAMTAQQAFTQLFREYVAPALRAEGFKGSGARYSRSETDGVIASLQVQKSPHSNRGVVGYAVHMSVRHAETIALFEAANAEARALGRATEDAGAANWNAQLNSLMGRPGPWLYLRADEPVDAHGQVLVARLRRFALPAIDEHVEQVVGQPLPRPTPPSERMTSEQDTERRRAERLKARGGRPRNLGPNPPPPRRPPPGD